MAERKRTNVDTAIDVTRKVSAIVGRKTPQLTALSTSFLGGLTVGAHLNFTLVDPLLWGENGLLTNYFNQKEAAALAEAAPKD